MVAALPTSQSSTEERCATSSRSNHRLTTTEYFEVSALSSTAETATPKIMTSAQSSDQTQLSSISATSSSLSCDEVLPSVEISGSAKTTAATVATTNSHQSNKPPDAPRSGRWTLDEKILFLYGLNKFGKGKWKKMSIYLPHRSLVQIKSHAQKVLKRLDAGENVYRRMEENRKRLDALVAEAHARVGISNADIDLKCKYKRKNRRSVSAATIASRNKSNKKFIDKPTTTPNRLYRSTLVRNDSTKDTEIVFGNSVPKQFQQEKEQTHSYERENFLAEEDPERHQVQSSSTLSHNAGVDYDVLYEEQFGKGAATAAAAALCQLASCWGA